MFTSILLAVTINQMTMIPPKSHLDDSVEIQFDSKGLQADLHAELELQMKQLSLAITQNIEDGILPAGPAVTVIVKD